MRHIFSDVQQFRREPLDFLLERGRQSCGLARLDFGPSPVYLVTDPELIKPIFKASEEQIDKGRLVKKMSAIIGSNSLTLSGTAHRERAQPFIHIWRVGFPPVTLDPDPDLEPDLGSGDDREGDDPDLEDGADSEPNLGWQAAHGYVGDQTDRSAPDFYVNADAGRDLEDEHDGGEPDIEEGSLGWPEVVCQHGTNWNGGFHGDKEMEHDGREPDVDLERSMGWRNEGPQTGGWFQDHPELEAGSPEWPAEHPTWQPPKRWIAVRRDAMRSRGML